VKNHSEIQRKWCDIMRPVVPRFTMSPDGELIVLAEREDGEQYEVGRIPLDSRVLLVGGPSDGERVSCDTNCRYVRTALHHHSPLEENAKPHIEEAEYKVIPGHGVAVYLGVPLRRAV
jgi:hypothetical protein